MEHLLKFYRSTVGKKVIMAVTGIFLFLFVFVHMVGNLQIYIGREELNRYSRFLHSVPEILWVVRIGVILSFVVHIIAAYQVWVRRLGAKPVKYRVKLNLYSVDPAAAYAARTMVWTGPLVLAFVLFHLLDLTYGRRVAGIGFNEADVYGNIVAGFQYWPVAVTYMVANVLLGLHLYHGLWAMFQSLGLEHPLWDRSRRWFAGTFAVVVAGANVSIPAAVLAGLVK